MEIQESLKKAIHRAFPYPWNTTSFSRKSRPGPLIEEVFDRIKAVHGWFNVDDCVHFHLILEMQSFFGLIGDLIEIGSYCGRSTAMLAYSLRSEERLVVCDAFDSGKGYPGKMCPTPELLMANIRKVVPDFPDERIVIHAVCSHELELKKSCKFRFAHIDGGHTKKECIQDLELCAPRMLRGGVLAVDDYAHYRFPGVEEAVELFRRTHPEFRLLADLNRHGAAGRKIYLIRNR